MPEQQDDSNFDHIIIGSGFGGSVAALRLAEKGHRVLVLEKGRRLKADDFPKTNWDLRRWLWMPALGFRGLFKMTFMRHVTVMSGVGVGGGSLVYANTLAQPTSEFFKADTWAHLADWEPELAPFYDTARTMLGATPNPRLEVGDEALREVARQIGREQDFHPTNVAVYFGETEVTAPDPYFGGEGPERTGCAFCGGCMVGCRNDGKNTLDKNYLHLAQRRGARIQAETEAVDVTPLDGAAGASGYRVAWRSTAAGRRQRGAFTCRGVVFAGGVLNTVPFLLRLRGTSLPRLSERVGSRVRTNSEALIGVTALAGKPVFSDGIAIGSILNTDEHSHLEVVRYPAGSGFWRLLAAPATSSPHLLSRLGGVLADLIAHPVRNLRVGLVDDWAKRTQILLFMQTINSELRLTLGRFGAKTSVAAGLKPTAYIPEARALADRFATIVGGKPVTLMSETLLGIPTTAHILGGCPMGACAEEGVIDADNRVWGYENLYVCDGSTLSANPGVNPSLTITALAERAMSKVAPA